MPTFNQPASVPTWCQNNLSNMAQPPDSLRDSGWSAGEPIPAEFFNYMQNAYGNWIGYLNQANQSTVLAGALDINTRLLGGGDWSYLASNSTLSWSDTAYLSIPGIDLSDNALAAGSVVLGANQVGYVTANAPYSITGALTKNDTHVTGLSTTTPIAVGQNVTGTGLAAGTTVVALDDSTVTLSQAATASNPNASLTFAGTGALTMQSQNAATFTPGPNTVVLAIGREIAAYVGVNSGQMIVRDGESKRLLGAGFLSVLRAPAGVALARGQAVYLSTSTGTVGQVFPCDASGSAGLSTGVCVGFAVSAAAQGQTAMLCTSGQINGLSGLTPGTLYFLDPNKPGGIIAGAPKQVGQIVCPVGMATTNTSLKFNPAAGAMAQAVPGNQVINGALEVDGALTVKPGSTGTAWAVYDAAGKNVVASADTAGAASFTGALSAASANVAGDAAVAGTLNVKNLYGTGGSAQAPAINLQTNLVGTDGSGASIRVPYVTATQTLTSNGTLFSAGVLKAAGGIKRALFLGGYTTTSFPGGSMPLVINYSGGDQARSVCTAFSGSVMSLTATFTNALPANAACALQFVLNGTVVRTQNLTMNGTRKGGYVTFNKGDVPFSAGDNLAALINYSNTGLNTSAQVDCTVESDA